LINFGRPCPVTDLFGAEGRRLLARLELPEPGRGNITAALELIDDLEGQIAETNARLKAGHADHPYIPLLYRDRAESGQAHAIRLSPPDSASSPRTHAPVLRHRLFP
jgi:hypothetical protein